MTDKPPYRVSVVLDCGFGERLITLAQNGPVWIIDNPDNQAAAETCWNSNPVARYLNEVAVFKGFDTSPEDTLIGKSRHDRFAPRRIFCSNALQRS